MSEDVCPIMRIPIFACRNRLVRYVPYCTYGTGASTCKVYTACTLPLRIPYVIVSFRTGGHAIPYDVLDSVRVRTFRTVPAERKTATTNNNFNNYATTDGWIDGLIAVKAKAKSNHLRISLYFIAIIHHYIFRLCTDRREGQESVQGVQPRED